MTRLFFLASTVLLLLGGCQQKAENGWTEFAPEGGGFSVQLPSDPVDVTGEDLPGVDSGPYGITEIHQFVLEPEGEGASYHVEYFIYPEPLLAFLALAAGGGMEEIVFATGKKLAYELEGNVVAETPTSIDEYPGNEVTIETPEGQTVLARMYLVKGTLYRLFVKLPADGSDTDARNFLESFKLVDEV